MTYNNTLAIITARGGSKGLPRKNVLPLGGKPLIAWTIEAALNAKCVRRVIVSTDDAEIAQASINAGAEVPFMRPDELSTDTAKSVDVVIHALSQFPDYENVMLLQPTSPLRTASDLDDAFELMNKSGCKSCVSVCEVEESPWLMYTKDWNGKLQPLLAEPISGLRRQDLPQAFRINGALYLAQIEWFLSERKFVGDQTVGFIMPSTRSIDIDTISDFEYAEQYFKQNLAR